MDREELLDSLAEDLFAYVMHGNLTERHVVEELRPNGLDERFRDFESLVRLHFVLRSDVVAFVEALPQRLRSVKTQTRDVSETSRGGIDGRIDWPATVRERYAKNPNDGGLFVCDNRHEDYDIAENVVLKRLLALLYQTLEDIQPFVERNYDWVTNQWTENTDLIASMQRIFERNVHVKRIRNPASYEPTERMLQRAANARSEVYREATTLLRTYRKNLRGEADALRDLLAETAITPDDDETLFELYVLFRHIAAIESICDDNFTVETLETGSQEVANIDTHAGSISIYHDSTAADPDLSFKSEPDEDIPNDELSRMERVQREARTVAKQYFTERKFKSVTGRPDVIVVEVQTDDTCEYLVTEVKNSKRVETIQQGIRETLEYLAFLRRDNTIVHEDSFFGSGWNGVLVIQDLEEVEPTPIEEQRSIKILQAAEVEEKLRRVFGEVLTTP